MTGRGPPPKLAETAALHQAGRLDEAERGYRRILREHRKDADTHYLLGVLRLQKGDPGQGLVLLRRALAMSPSMVHGLEGLAGAEEGAGRLGAALALAGRAGAAAATQMPALAARKARLLFTLGRYAEAERLFADLVRAGHEARPAALDRGLCLRRLGRTGEAEAVYAALLRAAPADPDALLGLGEARAEGGRPRDGMAPLRALVALAPAHLPARLRHAALRQEAGASAEALREAGSVVAVLPLGAEADALRISALSLMAAALRALGRPAQARGRLRRLLVLAPDLVDGWSNLSNLAAALGVGPAAAARLATRALATAPGHVGALTNRALALVDLERNADALRLLRRAVALVPADAMILSNFHGALTGLQAWDELDRRLRRALSIDPGFAIARYMLGTAALTRGELQRGWSLYRARFDPPNVLRPRLFPQPRWDGGPLAGRLLIWGEQGVGDEVLHASMLPDLARRGIAATVECDPRLVGMFARSFPGIEAVARRDPPDERLTAPDFIAQIPFGDLAEHLRPTLADFPREGGYLRPDPVRAAAARDWLTRLGDGFKVGIAWRSGRRDPEALRFHTELAQWGAILAVPGCRFVTLQYGDTEAELEDATRTFGVPIAAMPGLDLKADLDGLLALSASLDFVIATVSSAGHFAGASGGPLLQLTAAGEYLALGCQYFPWLPGTQGLMRPVGTPWEPTVGAAARLLAARAKARVTQPAALDNPLAC